MPEQLPHLGQRRAVAEQLAGHGMAQPVRPERRQAGPPARAGDYREDVPG